MIIVVGEPFSSQWGTTLGTHGQCGLCQQKDTTKWVTDHVYFVGKKALRGMTGELCIHCLNFQADEESQKVIDRETLRYVLIVQRQAARNVQNIQARWQARKLKRIIHNGGTPNHAKRI